MKASASQAVHMRVATFQTPIGRMAVAWTPRGLTRVAFPGDKVPDGEIADPPYYIRDFMRDVNRYFRGKRVSFRRYRVDLHGKLGFSWLVYRATRRIRWGKRATYGQLARMVGRPKAARAVGGCMARNPVPLVVPCHRVVGASGEGGFSARGGRKLKRKLLALENKPIIP